MTASVTQLARTLETEAHRLGLVIPEPVGAFVRELAQRDRSGRPAPLDWLDTLADVIDAIAPSRLEARARRTIVDDARTAIVADGHDLEADLELHEARPGGI